MQGAHTGRACMAESQQSLIQKEPESFPAVANQVSCGREAAIPVSCGGCHFAASLPGEGGAVTTKDGDFSLFDGQWQLRACRAAQVGG